jgi:DNA repair protein RadC
VCEAATSELLAVVLQGATVDQGVLENIARAIDTGGFRLAAEMPDELAPACISEPAVNVALQAALELARRAALAERPGIVRGPDDVAAIAVREVGALRQERVVVIVCDAANRHLRTIAVSQGASDRSPMPVRGILNEVLRWDGRAFAVAHNHPGGDPEPSDADTEATRQLEEAARLVGLRFLGHVVVSGGDHRVVEVVSASQKPR